MKRMSRREFLHRAGCAGAAAGVSRLLSGCAPLPPAAALPPPSQPTDLAARVAVGLGSDLGSMVRTALDALGGIASFVHTGETVFLKPNLIGAGTAHHELFTTGECTKPEIVVAVAEECLRDGAAHVVIGDGAQVRRFAWDQLHTLDGTSTLAAEAERLNAAYGDKVTLACLNADSPAWDPLDSPYSGFGQIYVSSLVARADRVISLPVLKTHRIAGVSLSLKNFMGVPQSARYGTRDDGNRMRLHTAPGGLFQAFLDVVAALQPDLTVIDASIGVEGNGPHVLPGWWGTTVDLRDRLGQWLVLASDDLVAADATATRVMSQDPALVPHLSLAYDRGLGQLREDLIVLEGAHLDELRVPWRPAEPLRTLGAEVVPSLMLRLE